MRRVHRHRREAAPRQGLVRRHNAAPRRLKLRLRKGLSGPRLMPITRLSGGPLPDPLPPGKRLDAGFARSLQRVSAQRGASWPLVLAELRDHGASGAAPASPAELRRLAGRVAAGHGSVSERVRALADYDWAVGIDGLVRGLEAVKRQLASRVLSNPLLQIYPGGRGDVAAGRIDVRVLVVMLYLAHHFHGITVTSLMTGHSIYTKSGNVSLHSSGRAVDVSALNGVPVLGHQQPGGITERALRTVLVLPSEMQPSELISLFALGGPSFALPDHANHIHIGF